jgi:FixJ family two-component response regulator
MPTRLHRQKSSCNRRGLDDTTCLITDLQMLGLSGVELQKSLLAQERHIPIIFMTAFPEERMRTRAMAGVVCYLRKPVDE